VSIDREGRCDYSCGVVVELLRGCLWRTRRPHQVLGLAALLLLAGLGSGHLGPSGASPLRPYDETHLLPVSDDLAAVVAKPSRTVLPGHHRTWGPLAPPSLGGLGLWALALLFWLRQGRAPDGVLRAGRPCAPRAPPSAVAP
jgi:hypothetical protein